MPPGGREVLLRVGMVLGTSILVLFVAGCRCGLDTSAIDDLKCSEAEPCTGGLECRDGYCQVPIGGLDAGSDGESDAGACVQCGPDCVDTDTDPLHCGRCGNSCGDEQACSGGSCVCTDGTSKACGDACVRTGSDPENCGDCGVTCVGGQVCSLGSCAETCAEGLVECDDACVDLATDADHCGGCATICDPDESCIRGTCARCASNADCDDLLACTADRCDDGICSHDLLAGRCLIGGLCRSAGERNPENACQACKLEVSTVSWSEDVDDGVACTVDSCVAGRANHQPDDGACPVSEVCALCAGGCVAPPALTLDCDDDAAAPGGQDATCTLGVTGDFPAACYFCSALVGMTSLVLEDFDECLDGASGWSLVEGDPPSCPIDPAWPPSLEPEHALGAEESSWAIERRLDTTDFDHVRLCFDWADRATDDGQFLEVFLQNEDQSWTSIFRGEAGPAVDVDYTWFTQCIQLEDIAIEPSAAGQPDLGLRFQVSASSSGKEVYLDRIAVDGWVEGDLEEQEFFTEGFTDCAEEGLGDWTVDQIDGRAPICPVVPGGGGAEVWRDWPAVQADDGTFALSRAVDASEICDDVILTFAYGASRTDGNELFVLQLDAGGGFVYEWGNEATNQAGAAPLDELATIVRNLSHRDPDVRFRSDLGIRFELTSDGDNRHLVLDDIVLRGMTCGPAWPRVTLGELLPDPGGSGHTFTVGSETQLTTYPICTWDGRSTTSARGRAAFLRR